jgi:hypothetical protein
VKLEKFTFKFKADFFINVDSYPKKWKRLQIIEAELDNFYDDKIGYLQVLVDEDDYEIEII